MEPENSENDENVLSISSADSPLQESNTPTKKKRKRWDSNFRSHCHSYCKQPFQKYTGENTTSRWGRWRRCDLYNLPWGLPVRWRTPASVFEVRTHFWVSFESVNPPSIIGNDFPVSPAFDDGSQRTHKQKLARNARPKRPSEIFGSSMRPKCVR